MCPGDNEFTAAQLTSIVGLTGLRGLGFDLAVVHNESLCISEVDAVGHAIEVPCIAGPPACDEAVDPPREWTTAANQEGC